jgi:hypothetical protein
MPVFQRVSFRLLNNPLSLAIPGPGEYVLGWQLFSPRMTPKTGTFLLIMHQEVKRT